jgi:hypothetical protein
MYLDIYYNILIYTNYKTTLAMFCICKNMNKLLLDKQLWITKNNYNNLHYNINTNNRNEYIKFNKCLNFVYKTNFSFNFKYDILMLPLIIEYNIAFKKFLKAILSRDLNKYIYINSICIRIEAISDDSNEKHYINYPYNLTFIIKMLYFFGNL